MQQQQQQQHHYHAMMQPQQPPHHGMSVTPQPPPGYASTPAGLSPATRPNIGQCVWKGDFVTIKEGRAEVFCCAMGYVAAYPGVCVCVIYIHIHVVYHAMKEGRAEAFCCAMGYVAAYPGSSLDSPELIQKQPALIRHHTKRQTRWVNRSAKS